MAKPYQSICPAMHRPNFCVECGERLTSRGWRARLGTRFCTACAHRLGRFGFGQPLLVITVIAFSTFALGRWLRPAPPPLIIQRLANSPLSDLPVDLNSSTRLPDDGKQNAAAKQNSISDSLDDVVYLCGARTQKGTPCRRRVHLAGERCYQHKGMPAIVPLDKLTVKNK
jgi:hypothetical protein